MQKIETRRGKTMEELGKMDIREFAKYVDSRARRTLLRQTSTIEKFMKKCNEAVKRGKQIRTHLRDIVIVPAMIGLTINIHNGKTFVPIVITADMIGHRLGEFAMTREKVEHGAPGIGATKSSAAASVK